MTLLQPTEYKHVLTPKELAEYAKVCRKHGITSLTLDGLTISLDISHDTSPLKQPAEQSAGPETDSNSLTEEEILNWSSGAPL